MTTKILHELDILLLLLFCFVLLCFALFCFVLLCFALFCFVLLCFALFCFVLLCFSHSFFFPVKNHMEEMILFSAIYCMIK